MNHRRKDDVGSAAENDGEPRRRCKVVRLRESTGKEVASADDRVDPCRVCQPVNPAAKTE